MPWLVGGECKRTSLNEMVSLTLPSHNFPATFASYSPWVNRRRLCQEREVQLKFMAFYIFSV